MLLINRRHFSLGKSYLLIIIYLIFFSRSSQLAARRCELEKSPARKTCDPYVLTKCEVLKISQKFRSCTCVGMNIRKVGGSEMFFLSPC